VLDRVGETAAAIPHLTYFLDRGVDLAVPDARGFTPLHKAAGYSAFICHPAFFTFLEW
jgi:ankyrin repeat protein